MARHRRITIYKNSKASENSNAALSAIRFGRRFSSPVYTGIFYPYLT